jgi:hypothetical protein
MLKEKKWYPVKKGELDSSEVYEWLTAVVLVQIRHFWKK